MPLIVIVGARESPISALLSKCPRSGIPERSILMPGGITMSRLPRIQPVLILIPLSGNSASLKSSLILPSMVKHVRLRAGCQRPVLFELPSMEKKD